MSAPELKEQIRMEAQISLPLAAKCRAVQPEACFHSPHLTLALAITVPTML